MRRRWNLAIWIGFAVVLAAGAAYLPLADRWPALGDWIALLAFVAGLLLIASGLYRAYREPTIYRGRIAGPVLMALAMVLTGFFAYGVFYVARHLPASTGAPRVGQQAPEFSLQDSEGRQVSLSGLLGAGGPDGARAVLLIFYRGWW